MGDCTLVAVELRSFAAIGPRWREGTREECEELVFELELNIALPKCFLPSTALLLILKELGSWEAMFKAGEIEFSSVRLLCK